MSTPRVSLPERAAAARARLEAEGIAVTEWSRQHGFNHKLVHMVLTGTRKCRHGESHRIAVALGIKDPPPSAALPTDPIESLRA